MSTLRASFEDQFEHTWVHTFGEDVSSVEREAWIKQTLQMAQEAGIALIHRETADGVEFAFFDEDNWAAFALNLTSNNKGTGDHRHTQSFDRPQLQNAWTALARTYLDQAGIGYEIEVRNGETEFRFGKLADRVIFNQLVNSGLLDEDANMLLQIQAFQDRVAGLDGPHNAI